LNNKTVTARGQTLLEWVVLFPLFFSFFLGCVSFAQWFLIRQQLILAVHEGALLYSSGRMEIPEVKRRMQLTLRRGHPALDVPADQIYIGRSDAGQARRFQLDRISVTYHPGEPILRFFQIKTMEESCTIKHAPPYGGTFWFKYGPPVDW
jgi:hypothetical protein